MSFEFNFKKMSLPETDLEIEKAVSHQGKV